MKYQPTIGLEIHAELKTASKMFCACKNDPLEKRPNFNICPICLGHPGTLPSANEEAIKKTLKVCLALNCKICAKPQFFRKNYFYPDLPKGFQITSQPAPFGEGGYLEIMDSCHSIVVGCRRSLSRSFMRDGNNRRHIGNDNSRGGNDKVKVSIHHIHLEEDTARLLHPEGASYSLVDFNRAGVPLMELVTEPDITSGQEARVFCQELQLVLRYLGVSDADMEKGQMRCEVNISLKRQETRDKRQGLGTKVEIKNLNSFRAVERAIDYEIKRQTEVLEAGEKVIQETRGWNEVKQATFSQRFKEQAHDYRYFPEPDLPPLDTQDKIFFDLVALKRDLPELPQARLARLQKEYGLPKRQVDVLVNFPEMADYFEQVVSELKEWISASGGPTPNRSWVQASVGDSEVGIEKSLPKGRTPDLYQRAVKLAANYLITELQKLLVVNKKTMADLKITPENFAEFISLICQDKISSSGAQALLLEMFKSGGDPSQIIETKQLAQISDQASLEAAVARVIEDNPKPVADFQLGKENALQFLVGQVMRQTRGQANPKMAQEILRKKLAR